MNHVEPPQAERWVTLSADNRLEVMGNNNDHDDAVSASAAMDSGVPLRDKKDHFVKALLRDDGSLELTTLDGTVYVLVANVLQDDEDRSNGIAATHVQIQDGLLQSFGNLQTVDMAHTSLRIVLGERTFEDCPSLENVRLGEISVIPKRCFKDCRAFASVVWPRNSQERIEAYAFQGCCAMRTMGWLTDNLKTLEEGAFDDCAMLLGDFEPTPEITKPAVEVTIRQYNP
mmetsp:Transcript_25983/g.71560  ORF Transcript_25983/g.71560 Transcript_25983/m.71560 type:complete len:229 (-) Transcript_25983:82-768(-)|eukprot:CAMPEP_0168749878 /NCGR_PEP_ID=MMETSP0724-20121128/16961_1 /TAXON_ID=265536 /ORGANISM="Amphiprora sp., Strain CCMP467" /LENGTH=228 /DNA_ID=CAMNT_0008797837 /DNA_START=171 /DNA_END=857 /DNA_ORIENTATION=+